MIFCTITDREIIHEKNEVIRRIDVCIVSVFSVACSNPEVIFGLKLSANHYPQNISLLGLAVSEDIANKRTHTYSLISYCFRGEIEYPLVANVW